MTRSKTAPALPLVIRKSQRGFKYAEFRDRYQQKCSIQESSLATEPCLWLGVDTDLNGKDSSRMHLTRPMAEELVKALEHFIKTGELPLE